MAIVFIVFIEKLLGFHFYITSGWIIGDLVNQCLDSQRSTLNSGLCVHMWWSQDRQKSG
jgi:hypothetical protein